MKLGFLKRIYGDIGLALWLLLLSPFTQHVHAAMDEFEIEVAKPIFVLPQFTGEYQEREASIAPEEYEMAERLRSLLDSEQKEDVLAELETFYDIELSPAMQTLKAQIYFSLNKYPEAENTYLAILKRKPQFVRAHTDLAQLYLLTEKPLLARKHFARAVEYGSNEAIVHGQLAYLNLTQHGPFSAISEYQQAMALEPENRQWQQGLLAALYQARMYAAADALLGELLARYPKEAELWLSRATLALRQDDSTGALAGLEMAILLGDLSETNLRAAAQLHLQLHSYDRALVLLKTHLQNTHFKMATLHEYLNWMAQAKMWSHAEALLASAQTRVAEMSVMDQSLYYLHRGRVSVALEKDAQAQEAFEKSLELNPSNGQALLSYADFNAKHERLVKAELLYIRAEAIESSEKEALLGRSQLYIDMQDYAAALIHLKNAYNKFPELFDLLDNIHIIENIIRAQK